MTLHLIEQEIQRFLRSAVPEVLCLKGQWGVGKTYSWNYLLEMERQKAGIALSAYSYVSMFGINTLDELKLAILANSVSVSPHASEAPNSWYSKIRRSAPKSVGRGAQVAQGIPLLRDYLGNFPVLTFRLVRDTIVCIDDLERKGAQLRTRDVLGLISELREQKNCKVMLILNDTKIEGEDKSDFNLHNEKVIDASLEFAPSPQDCLRIAFGNSDAARFLSKNCVKLGIANIRILKKIERLFFRIQEHLKNYDEQVLFQAAHTITLFTWAEYSRQGPSLDFIANKQHRVRVAINEKPSEEEAQWLALLNDYGFGYLDDLDQVLFEGIRRGFFDAEKLYGAASVLQKSIEQNQSQKIFEAAWDLYYDSYDDNLEAVVSAMGRALKECVANVSPLNLDATVTLFRELGLQEEAEEMIAYYMENRKGNREFYDLKAHHAFREVQDEAVRDAFTRKYNSFEDERDPGVLLLEIGEKSEWSEDDIARLAKLSADDFYSLFKANKGDKLRTMLKTSLRFGGSADAATISARAKEALAKIGAENPLNKLRVKRLGIDVQ